MELIFSWAYSLFRKIGMNDTWASYISMMVNILLLVVLTFFIYFVFRLILVTVMAMVARKTKTNFDDLFISSKTAKYISHLTPLFLVYKSVPIILKDFVYWETIFGKMIGIYIVILLLWITQTLLNALKTYLKTNPKYSDKPIESYVQVMMMVLWSFGVIFIILYLFNTSIAKLVATFGAISALIILIFRDTILGFAASIQVTINDLVRIGDWITVEKFGADGEVVEINLATVLIRNFDQTTTTIPTYSLLSNSFKNWRGMLTSEGRRIKRHFLIKSNSIRFISIDELNDFKSIQLIENEIDALIKEQESTQGKQSWKSTAIQHNAITNVGLFKIYVEKYLSNHPEVNTEMLIMCRLLQSTAHGVPVEFYAFAEDKRFVEFEQTMGKITEHLMASLIYFDLALFELPSGKGILET
jgi:miniconductance mechanosensitive channel